MKDRPLQVKVEKDELVIRVGIDTLAYSAEYCPLFYDGFNDPANCGPYVKVVDNLELANDVARALTSEEEDGSGPLVDLLDQMILDAFEDGSIAFNDEDD